MDCTAREVSIVLGILNHFPLLQRSPLDFLAVLGWRMSHDGAHALGTRRAHDVSKISMTLAYIVYRIKTSSTS